MFAVCDTLISDDLLDAPFTCNLNACHGACCVEGTSGAPLEADERALLEDILPRVRPFMRSEALAVVERDGVWEADGPDGYATTCVDGAECVFVTYDGPVAKCAIQKAYEKGRIDVPKPISCHLFPIRVERHGTYDVLNYERVALCEPACTLGKRRQVQLVDMVREALQRKFGAAWYEAFRATWEERRRLLGLVRSE